MPFPFPFPVLSVTELPGWISVKVLVLSSQFFSAVEPDMEMVTSAPVCPVSAGPARPAAAAVAADSSTVRASFDLVR